MINLIISREEAYWPDILVNAPVFCVYTIRSGTRLNTSYTNNITQHSLSKTELQESPSSSPTFNKYQSRPQEFDKASQESFCSIPDPVDPATVTKTFKAGKKASAQANLASWSKTPKNRRSRKSKGHKNSEGTKVKSLS